MPNSQYGSVVLGVQIPTSGKTIYAESPVSLASGEIIYSGSPVSLTSGEIIYPEFPVSVVNCRRCPGLPFPSPAPNYPTKGGVTLVSLTPPTLKSDTASKRVPEHPELSDALMDLHSLKRIAKEEGEVPPENKTIENAEALLRELFRLSPRPYFVYSMPNGEIAIDADSPRGTKLVLICHPDSSARLLFHADNKTDRKEYRSLNEIPNRFIIDALLKTRKAQN